MKKLLLVGILFLTVAASAQSTKYYTLDDVPNVQLTDRRAFVSDPENAVSPAYMDSLNTQLAFLRDSIGIQCAVVVIPAVDGDDAVDFAYRLFNYWGIGDKDRNNGLLLLLLTGDDHREIKFETGYGLEGSLPDAICKRIQTQAMLPYLREQNWGAGLLAGVRAVTGVLSEDPDAVALYAAPLAAQEDFELSTGATLVITGIILLWLFLGLDVLIYPISEARKKRKQGTESDFAIYMSFKEKKDKMGCWFLALFIPLIPLYLIAYGLFNLKLKNRGLTCPVCGNPKMAVSPPTILKAATTKAHGKAQKTATCPQCKHQETYSYATPLVVSSDSTGGSSGYGSSSGGSSFSGGSWGGGSSSGGSWGGGSSGGGGASTRF